MGVSILKGLLEFLQACWDVLPKLLGGCTITIELTLVTIALGTILGLIVALARISKIKPLSKVMQFYIWVLRGTPLLLQLFFLYYALPNVGIVIDRFPSAAIAFVINLSAYMAEIIRSGIQSIDKGQMEAAKALGMTYMQAIRRVIIPQAIKRMIPPASNEFTAVVKDTALVSFISLPDLMKRTKDIFAGTYAASLYEAALVSAILYLTMTTLITYVFGVIEKKLSIYE